jgi:hypothetical protein
MRELSMDETVQVCGGATMQNPAGVVDTPGHRAKPNGAVEVPG